MLVASKIKSLKTNVVEPLQSFLKFANKIKTCGTCIEEDWSVVAILRLYLPPYVEELCTEIQDTAQILKPEDLDFYFCTKR